MCVLRVCVCTYVFACARGLCVCGAWLWLGRTVCVHLRLRLLQLCASLVAFGPVQSPVAVRVELLDEFHFRLIGTAALTLALRSATVALREDGAGEEKEPKAQDSNDGLEHRMDHRIVTGEWTDQGQRDGARLVLLTTAFRRRAHCSQEW